jgi:UDP-2,3-diacylglucosamine hydrolase
MRIFISDAHIRTDDSCRARALCRFLAENRSKISALYILGDLFEFWFEYNVVFPKYYFKILASLYNYVQEGKKVHYVLGNHEVMIGNFLNNFGFTVYQNEAVLDIEGRRVYLAHGHKVDKRLWNALWEGLLTSKLNHALYSLIHPDMGVFLAQGIAHLSRKQRRSANLSCMLERFAQRKLKDFDVVMLAHTHMPEIRKYPGGRCYVNTGDWIDNFSYAKMQDGEISLNYYKPSVPR